MTHTVLFRRLMLALQQARRDNLKAEGQPAPLTKAQAGWTRRRFLNTAALAGVTAAVSSALPLPVRALTAAGAGRASQVAIVGAGLAGLNAAYQLKKAGISATVYEAQQRVGGRVLSVTGAVGEGLVTDLGGSFINSDHQDMLGLAQEFGLDLFDRLADAARSAVPRIGYFFEGRAHAEAEVAEDLRALAAQIARDSQRLDADVMHFAPKFDRLSAKAYLDRHARLIRKAYLRRLIEGAIRTEYGVEPEESSALQLIDMLPTVEGQAVDLLGYSDEMFVVKGGAGKLIDSLAEQLGGQIRTEMPLTRLESCGERWQLTFATGESVTADVVIVTIPFTALREVVLEVPLPQRLRRFIRELDLGHNEKLIAGFNQRAWRQAGGFVTEAWTDLGYSEVWEETQRQPERPDGALTFFLGGREVAVLGEGNARSVGGTFVQQLEEFTPGVVAAATGRFLSTHWSQNRFTRGAYVNFKPGQLTRFGGLLWVESEKAEERQEVHVGNLIFAGEHLSDAFYGFMNGAAQTGRLAADVVVRRLTAGLTVIPDRQRERRVA